MWNWMEMPENAKLHQQSLFHCLITFSSEIDNRGRLVFGRAAHRHNNVRLSAIQKPSKSPRTLEYVITLKFYRWTLSRKNKHRPMASARCLSLSLCCIHIFHRLKCFSHSWKLLERDVRERKESGRWELRPKKKRSFLTTLHSLFFHCVSHCMHFLSSVILITSPPFPPSFCHCCL